MRRPAPHDPMFLVQQEQQSSPPHMRCWWLRSQPQLLLFPQPQNTNRRMMISQMQEQLLSKPNFVTSLVLLWAIICPFAAGGILSGLGWGRKKKGTNDYV